MTAQQALRAERRRMLAEKRRQHIIEDLLTLLGLIAIILAFAIAGTMDYYDEQAQHAHWAEQGVTLGRW